MNSSGSNHILSLLLKNRATSNSTSFFDDNSEVLIAHEEEKSLPDHPASVLDVAAYILSITGKISTMKLQKLVYYCQAWSLVWEGTILYSEPIEAWANGPVVRELFNFHRGMYEIESIHRGNPKLLTSIQKETIDIVLGFYCPKSAYMLVDLVHSEKPWIEARRGLDPAQRGCRQISLETMQEYYSSL